MRLFLAALLVSSVALAQPFSKGGSRPAVPNEPVAQCEGIQIFSQDLSDSAAQRYCVYAVSERAKVDKYWGATWPGLIRIHIDRGYSISRALVPGHFGNRGFMEMPTRRMQANEGSLLHEIVHIYAPNANRFLAEGLELLEQEWRASFGARL